MSVRESLEDRWSEALWWDYAASAALVAGHLAVIKFGHMGDWLLWLDSSQRVTVYGTAASIVSAIGGLSAIAISIYTAASGRRAQAVRTHYHRELRRSWRSLLVATAVACMLFLAGQSLDVASDPYYARLLFEFGISFAGFRFLRLIWLFDAMMKISDRDLEEREPEVAPTVDEGWPRSRSNNS